MSKSTPPPGDCPPLTLALTEKAQTVHTLHLEKCARREMRSARFAHDVLMLSPALSRSFKHVYTPTRLPRFWACQTPVFSLSAASVNHVRARVVCSVRHATTARGRDEYTEKSFEMRLHACKHARMHARAPHARIHTHAIALSHPAHSHAPERMPTSTQFRGK